jgi:hypothetical protein
MSETKRPKARHPEPKTADIAIVGGPTEDGQGAHVLRIRDGNLSAGELRPLREGEPITHSEVVRLHPMDGQRRVCEVEVLHAPAQEKTPKPQQTQEPQRRARVSTPSYRKNWSAVFEQKKKRSPKDDWSVN